MGLRDWLGIRPPTIDTNNMRNTDLIEIETKSVGALKDDAIFWKSFTQLAAMAQGEITDPYSQSIWVYATVKAIAQNIASTPMRLYKQKTKSSKEEVTKGPLYELFLKPNRHMTPQQLVEATMTYLDINGEAFWYLEGRKNVTDIPTAIHTLRPRDMDPIIRNDIHIGWTFMKGTRFEETFSTDEVMQFKYFNPENPYKGMSPLTAAKQSIDQDYYAAMYNRSFFKEGAAVGGFIQVDKELTTPAFNRLREQFDERHKGMMKAHKIGILEGGATFQEAKLSQKDMDFIALRKLSRQEIFAIFKANDVALGVYDSVKSYEGIKSAKKDFWQSALIPRINYIVEALWSNFFSKIDGGSTWMEFDLSTVSALQDDFRDKVTMAKDLVEMGWPLNMVNKRLEMNMDDVAWGNVAWMASGKVPISGPEIAVVPIAIAAPVPAASAVPQKLFKTVTEMTEHRFIDHDESISDILALKAGDISSMVKDLANDINSEESTYRKTVKEAKTVVFFNGKQLKHEKLFEGKIKRFLFEQRGEVLEKLFEVYPELTQQTINYAECRGVADDLLLFSKNQEVKLKKIFKALYEVVIKDGAEMILTEVDTSQEYDPSYEGYTKTINDRLDKMPGEIVSTIRKQLDATLLLGLEGKESMDELATRVRTVYNQATSRASIMARTESSNVLNAGRFKTMEKLNIKEHRWLSAGDEKTRVSHQKSDGMTEMIGKVFASTSSHYPGDLKAPAGEVINCRCITVPVVP